MAIGIRCKGKVQGVFFRATTKSRAEDLGLTGWVKNEESGDVLIYAEGSEKALNALSLWCKEGPEFAKVTEVEVWKESNEHGKSFEILY